MQLKINLNKDFWAGVMFIGTGAAAMFISREYGFGSVLSMGAGFFPTLLGGILVAFGISILVMGLRRSEKIQGHLSLRALILMPVSLVLFGIMIYRTGFMPALVTLVILSAASGKEFKLTEVLLLAGGLTLAAVAVFIWGLGLPYPLIKGF